MQSFDFAPLYRSSIGFDRVANLLDTLSKNDQAVSPQGQPSYPPYNIELTGENRYQISLAVAGFERSELEVNAEENQLLVRGKKAARDREQGKYLHRGIATRNFERRFQLADHVRVDTARYENGLLHIDLLRELPERLKPRSIEIATEGADARAGGDRDAT